MENDASDPSNYALSHFHRQQLNEWTATEQKGFHGGQACICFLESKDQTIQAVFRCLKPSASGKDRIRFKRELNALSKIDHENIVKPLAQGRDWYISERGCPLRKHWDQFVEENTAREIENSALEIIRCIANGLAECHRAGLVHCDVKPDNVIVLNNRPVIIDFGLVTDPSFNRITDVGEPKGNRLCTHDIARFGESPPPWTDIFSLVQIFLQMMLPRVNKQALRWQRPIHWQYATYSDELSEEFCLGLRALSATCSTELLCPKDASQFLILLNNLFQSPKRVGEKPEANTDGNAAASYRSGLADKKIREALDQETINASSEVAGEMFRRLIQSIRSNPKYVDMDFEVSEEENPLPTLLSSLNYSENPSVLDAAHEIYQISANSPDQSCRSYVRICIAPLRPSRSVRKSAEGDPFNMFFLELYFGGKLVRGGQLDGDGDGVPSDFLHLGISRVGEFWKFSRSFAEAEHTLSCGEIADLCLRKLLDSTLWKNLGTRG